jgi:hypothetical protein
MTIAFRVALGSSVSSGSPVTLVVTVPAGVQNNDVMVMGVTVYNGSNRSVSTPSGWTLLSRFNQGAFVAQVLFWRRASSEPASYSISIAGSGTTFAASAIIIALSGADTSAPTSAQYGGQAGHDSSNTISAGSIGAFAVRNGLSLFFASAEVASARTPVPPTGYTQPAGGNVFVALAQTEVAYKALSAVTSVGALSETWAGTTFSSVGGQVFIFEPPNPIGNSATIGVEARGFVTADAAVPIESREGAAIVPAIVNFESLASTVAQTALAGLESLARARDQRAPPIEAMAVARRAASVLIESKAGATVSAQARANFESLATTVARTALVPFESRRSARRSALLPLEATGYSVRDALENVEVVGPASSPISVDAKSALEANTVVRTALTVVLEVKRETRAVAGDQIEVVRVVGSLLNVVQSGIHNVEATRRPAPDGAIKIEAQSRLATIPASRPFPIEWIRRDAVHPDAPLEWFFAGIAPEAEISVESETRVSRADGRAFESLVSVSASAKIPWSRDTTQPIPPTRLVAASTIEIDRSNAGRDLGVVDRP